MERSRKGSRKKTKDALGCLFFGRSRTGEEIGRDLRTKVPQQQKASGQQSPESHGTPTVGTADPVL